MTIEVQSLLIGIAALIAMFGTFSFLAETANRIMWALFHAGNKLPSDDLDLIEEVDQADDNGNFDPPYAVVSQYWYAIAAWAYLIFVGLTT